MEDIRAIAFDKDGTLFDFQATWAVWTGDFIREIAGPFGRADALAERGGFDLESGRHRPDSPFIAGTLDEYVSIIRSVLPELQEDDIRARLHTSTARVRQVPAVPLGPLLGELSTAGLKLGVVTNDSETLARGHLDQAGVLERFDFIAGFDSGFGAKPAPGMLLGFAQAVQVLPEQILMVGDSLHDLHAAEAAGMPAVAVLTGYAETAELAPFARAVLPDIGHLPAWLEARKATEGMSQTAMPGPSAPG